MPLSSPSRLGTSLNELLGREIQEAAAFITLLKDEQALLAAGKVEALLSLVEKKTGFAARLGGLGQSREQVLKANGFETGRVGMDACIAKLLDKALASSWEKLLILATEARALNELNGKLIRLHLQHNQDALNTLLAAGSFAATYGPDGQQPQISGGRLLGSA